VLATTNVILGGCYPFEDIVSLLLRLISVYVVVLMQKVIHSTDLKRTFSMSKIKVHVPGHALHNFFVWERSTRYIGYKTSMISECLGNRAADIIDIPSSFLRRICGQWPCQL
jgi:hypothetical protein